MLGNPDYTMLRYMLQPLCKIIKCNIDPRPCSKYNIMYQLNTHHI